MEYEYAIGIDVDGIQHRFNVDKVYYSIDCRYKQLVSLYLSNCPNVKIIFAEFNKLTNLDLSFCKDLEILDIRYSKLIELNLSNNLKS